MNLWVDPLKLIDRMGLNGLLDNVPAAAASAISAAQQHVQSVYDTRFARQTQTDVFLVDSKSFSGVVPGGLFRLHLRNALVATNVVPVVQISSENVWHQFDTTPDPNLSTVDNPRGIVYLDRLTFADQYVAVTYTSGVAPLTNPGTGTAQDSTLPEYLEEAILTYAPLMYDIGQATNREAQETPLFQAASVHAQQVLDQYVRNIGFMFKPLV